MYYNKTHSIKIRVDGTSTWYDTWENWHLIPSKAPSIAPPGFRSKYVEIPGRDSQLDISTILTGKPLYDQRTGSWGFIIANRYRHRETLYSEILEAIHGQKVDVMLSDAPECFYKGRIAVSAIDIGRNNTTISFNYTLEPRKYFDGMKNSTDGYLWDPLNFERDEIDMAANPQVIKNITPIM